MESFAERLAASIDESGITRSEVARRVGIGWSLITEYCKGRCIPKRDTVFKLASVLNVAEDWLIGMDGAVKHRTDAMTPELTELVRIYQMLDVKKRTQLLTFAYKLEDNQ